MRKKTVEKIKKIINDTVFRKYWGNRVAMPYVKNGGLGDITWQQLGGSPADSNSFVSYMVLNYYTKQNIDPIVAGIEERLDSVEDTLYPHVNNDTIHVTSEDKTRWNSKVDSVIKEITEHETVNTYEVPTLTVEDVTELYNAVVRGNLAKIHFDPDELGITSDFLVEEASNIVDVGIKFLFQDSMILTYTIVDDPEDPTQNVIQITYKEIGGTQPHLYRHIVLLNMNLIEDGTHSIKGYIECTNNKSESYTNFQELVRESFGLNVGNNWIEKTGTKSTTIDVAFECLWFDFLGNIPTLSGFLIYKVDDDTEYLFDCFQPSAYAWKIPEIISDYVSLVV